MFPKSIRWRLQMWQAFLLVCILSGFGVTAYQLHRMNLLRQIDEELGRRVAALAGDVRGGPGFELPPGRPPLEPWLDPMPDRDRSGPPPGRPRFNPDRQDPPSRRGGPEFRGSHRPPEEFFDSREIHLSAATANLFGETGTNDFFFAIWARQGTLLKRSTNAPAGLTLPARPKPAAHLNAQTQGAARQAFLFTEIGECILVGRPITTDLAALRRFAWLLVAAGTAVLALGLGGGWLFTSRALRPVADISDAASRISAGRLAERINVAESDSELGRLAGVLNSTFARLEAAFAQQQQFTADASHELRTPIAVIISEAQTTLARERSAAEYRETVEACLDAAQQMRRLADSLLELARYDAGQESLERHPVDLAEPVCACVERVQPLARQRGIQVHCDLAPAPALIDPDRLSQAITNLLTNAIHYNQDGGTIRVATRREPGLAVLTVTDTGLGITPEDLPHIGKRFFRADKSRARAAGRTGLGLAITQAILDGHGSRLEISSELGVGTTCVVRLPEPGTPAGSAGQRAEASPPAAPLG